ncbi:hypothetical protein MHBO_005149 [Bonamia ostreae]|uniref:Uncharacterized protein n=1 Tax=Bonamia ostreae TaxID=126728 RepID=A0ABV2AWA5_9EUKA
MTLFLCNLSLKHPLTQWCILLLLFSQSLVFAQGVAEPTEVVASESVVASSLRGPSVQTVQDVDRSLSVLSDREIRVKLRQTLIENLAETSVVSTETWSEKVKTGLLNTVKALQDSVIKIGALGDAFRQLHAILLSNIENSSSILIFFLMVISSLL